MPNNNPPGKVNSFNAQSFIGQGLISDTYDENSIVTEYFNSIFKKILLTKLTQNERFELYTYIGSSDYEGAMSFVFSKYPSLFKKIQTSIQIDLMRAYAK